MKKMIQVGIALALAGIATGCATPYIQARGHDAKDIFTFTVGDESCGGIKARVGPINAGLYSGFDHWGIRSGLPSDDWGEPGFEILLLGFGVESFPSRTSTQGYGTAPTFFFVSPPMNKPILAASSKDFPKGNVAQFWTQIDLALGIYWPVRIGFNPGELLDFVLGWTTLDIYGDDAQYLKKDRTKSRTVPLEAGASGVQ